MNIPLLPDNRVERAIGTVVHAALQRLSSLEEARLSRLDLEGWRPWIRERLKQLFVDSPDLDRACTTVAQNLQAVLADEKGRWAIAVDREQGFSEYALSSLREDGRLLEMVVDRAFVADGVRWIVDYKSSRPGTGESLVDFLRREEERYRDQLHNYRLAFEDLQSIPVKTALYFTAIACWHECDAAIDSDKP